MEMPILVVFLHANDDLRPKTVHVLSSLNNYMRVGVLNLTVET